MTCAENMVCLSLNPIRKINPLCTVESRTGRKADMENGDPFGYQGIGTGKLLLVTILKRNGKAWIHMETESEIYRFKGSGNGTVHPATVSWKNYSEEEIRGQILQPKVKRIYQKPVQIHPKRKLTGIQALYYSYLYQMGVLPKRPRRSPYAVREDIRKLDQRIEQIEFLMKHDITTREQLSTYREPLQKQISELMKERRKLYRNGSEDSRKVRLSEINEELKNLRKEVRMTVRIEKHSLEIEERLRKAEEQNQNEKRVEHKEKESQEVR